MPSSPVPLSDASMCRAVGLVQVLADLPDPRRRRGVRHGLVGLVMVALAAVTAGARSYAAIGGWAAELTGDDLARAPEQSTFRRVFGRLDAAVLDGLVGAFLWTRTATVARHRVIAIDGKTLRGARTATTAAPHLVAAVDHASGAVLGQLTTAAKSNETPTVRTLLKTFHVNGVVGTVDAMHTQTNTATAITAAGGDYVFTVKANQPTLYAACTKLPWRDVGAHSTLSTGCGRRVRRTTKVVAAPTWITFAGAAQVAQIHRTTTRNGNTTVEVVYVITSADHRAAPPTVLAAWIQGHRGIENRTHWVRDVTYDEDRSRVRTGNAPHVMATLRNTAISLRRLSGATNIAASLRQHAARTDRPINLVLTS